MDVCEQGKVTGSEKLNGECSASPGTSAAGQDLLEKCSALIRHPY